MTYDLNHDVNVYLLRAEFTLVQFYFVYDDAAATDGLAYLGPNDLMAPSDAALEAELVDAGFDGIDVQAAPVFKNIQNSFALFIDGVIYDEDIQQFLDILQMFWRTEQGARYTEVTCVNGFIEKYFTSVDT